MRLLVKRRSRPPWSPTQLNDLIRTTYESAIREQMNRQNLLLTNLYFMQGVQWARNLNGEWSAE